MLIWEYTTRYIEDCHNHSENQAICWDYIQGVLNNAHMVIHGEFTYSIRKGESWGFTKIANIQAS